jgi:hypothetical protein
LCGAYTDCDGDVKRYGDGNSHSNAYVKPWCDGHINPYRHGNSHSDAHVNA